MLKERMTMNKGHHLLITRRRKGGVLARNGACLASMYYILNEPNGVRSTCNIRLEGIARSPGEELAYILIAKDT